ncbi:MAG: hypothetical protein ABWZ15_10800 [Acidimicrobiia bacterium]
MLTGRVVIVVRADTDEGARAATEVAAAGANLVLVGEDAARLGILAAELTEIQGVQTAIYIGTSVNPTLAELVTDLFPR